MQTHTRPSDIYQLPQFPMCVMSHTYPHLGLQLSAWFPPLHNNPQTAALRMPTSPSKLQVFWKCHIYSIIYVFLNYWTCVRPCYHLIGFYLFFFKCHWWSFWVCSFSPWTLWFSSINFVQQNFQGLFQMFRLRIELTIRLRFLLWIPGCMITHFIERGFVGGTGETAALALDILSLKFQQLELTKTQVEVQEEKQPGDM